MKRNRVISAAAVICLVAGLLTGCGAVAAGDNGQIRNLAPLSSLKSEFPGYVDGVINVSGTACGGGGGPCLNLNTNSFVVITFDQTYRLDRLTLFVGCEDRETMDGEVWNLTDGEKVSLASFQSKGCGDAISWPETSANRISIVMTAGGGTDNNISVEEIEIYGK